MGQGLVQVFVDSEPEGTPISFDELQRIGAEHDLVLRDPTGG